ncbi:MAG: tail fiber domain-containing protein [Bacteroidales bacterium]|nr:tail fiber domain-containing protein [Bacteroidales bacterium]
MKTINYIAIIAIAFSTTLTAQIKVNSTGKVKIGSLEDPTKNLDVKGNVIFKTVAYTSGNLIIDNTGWQGYQPAVYPQLNNAGSIGKIYSSFKEVYSYSYPSPSDSRQKENVRDIENALDIVLQLKGVKYDLKKDYAYNDSSIKDNKYEASIEKDRKNKIGFIAQDVYKILPEVTTYNDSADMYAIDYAKVVPVLVEAIKEQQLIIRSLQSEIENSKLKSTSNPANNIENPLANENALFQNSPNPFTENTIIKYFIKDDVNTASICVYDMNGSQKKNILLTDRGYSAILINGNELQAGMYLYMLVADGKTIDTKQMVLTQ